MSYKAVIAGASGLIGQALLKAILAHEAYEEVIILVRSALQLQHKKLVQVIVNFDELESYASIIEGHALFCCLGTTRSKTPNMADYRTIDYEYPVQLAEIALRNKIKQYHLVSSMGANVNAPSWFYYAKIKGETEQAIEEVKMPCLHIYRPSLLTGQRNEHRPNEQLAEKLMRFIDPLLIGGLKKYRSIPAAIVAQAMLNQSLSQNEGTFVHPSDHIKQLA